MHSNYYLAFSFLSPFTKVDIPKFQRFETRAEALFRRMTSISPNDIKIVAVFGGTYHKIEDPPQRFLLFSPHMDK